MLQIVQQAEDFKLDNGIATDVICKFPYPTYTKGGFTYVSNPKPTGFVIQLNGYSAMLMELKNGKIVRETPYIFNICDNFGPTLMLDMKQRLETCNSIEEAQQILESVRMSSFTNVDGEANVEGMTELFSFTTDSGPIAYWIGGDSVEKEADNESNIRVYANNSWADYLAIDYNAERGMVVMHVRKNGTYDTFEVEPCVESKIPPDCNTVMFISALYSAIAKRCVAFDTTGDVSALVDEIKELIKSYDYTSYMNDAPAEIVLPGGISAADKNFVPEEISGGKMEVAEAMAGERSIPNSDGYYMEPTKPNVVEIPKEREEEMHMEQQEMEQAPEKVEPVKKGPVEDTRGRRATNLWLTASLFDKTPEEIEKTPIHNYTGHPVKFINNAVRGQDGRMTIPPEGPNVILDLPPEGRLTSANTYIDLGYVQGIPVSDIAPVKLSAIPKLDGIIIVSPVYFNDALRAGFDMSNLYTLNMKIQINGKNGKPETYYVGLTKRF